MAQSPEYPDLPWVPPRAWGSGRDGKAVRYIVIHYTAGAERNTSAEDGARIDQNRTDGTSTHYFADSDSVVQCVLTKDRANAARTKGNRLGIQYELCGTVQSRAQWLDAASLPTLRNAARQVARDCRKYSIPVRRLSVAETRAAWYSFPAGPKGIVGHVDVTYAYPEDGGDHTDPGTEFPWDVFLDMVRAEMEGDVALDSTDLGKIEDIVARYVGDVVHRYVVQDGKIVLVPETDPNPRMMASSALQYIQLTALQNQLALKQLGAQVDEVDEAVWSKISDPATPDEQVAAALDQLLGDRKASILALMQR